MDMIILITVYLLRKVLFFQKRAKIAFSDYMHAREELLGTNDGPGSEDQVSIRDLCKGSNLPSFQGVDCLKIFIEVLGNKGWYQCFVIG